MKVADWRPADGFELEPNAEAACREVTTNVAVIAGPGSGKTELLAQRGDFLLRTNICPYPRRILAISFKVDAARNLEKRVRDRCGPDLAARLDSYTFDAFALGLVRRFRLAIPDAQRPPADFTPAKEGNGHNVIAFKRLVPLALEILDHPDVIRELRAAYSHLFLDEFQDCTDPQYQLVKKAFHDTETLVTAVGDTKQRIMGWVPGALEDAFGTYGPDFQVVDPLNLYENFRSLPVLRRMQNRMIAVMDHSGARDPSELNGDEGTIETLSTSTDDEEAAAVIAWIKGRLADGVAPEDIALLMPRTPEAYTWKIRASLEAADVPLDPGDAEQSLRSEPLAQLIVDHLRLASGSPAPDAYARLTGSALFFAETETASDRLRTGWNKLRHRLRRHLGPEASRLRSRLNLLTAIGEFVALFPDESLTALHPTYTAPGRIGEVQVHLANHLVHLLSGSEEVSALLRRFGKAEGVQIMTTYKSKGLEFDSVVLLGVERETYWGTPHEEEALFFVGISRAKANLLLTHTSRRPRPDGYYGRWHVGRRAHNEFLGYAIEPLTAPSP
ncbi:UvrD-helicase domain-containing protein [Nocardioides sp. WG-D5]